MSEAPATTTPGPAAPEDQTKAAILRLIQVAEEVEKMSLDPKIAALEHAKSVISATWVGNRGQAAALREIEATLQMFKASIALAKAVRSRNTSASWC